MNKKVEKKKILSKNDKIIENTSVQESTININNTRKEVVDICTIIEKCSIDEISKYLLEKGTKKDFPDITTR